MAAPARVDPMNAVSRHSKVKVFLKFAEQRFVSGEHVAGKMELECKTDSNLALGIIMVELLAFEELLSRDHSAAQTFLHSRRVFQGPDLPPSNAVHPYPLSGEILPKDYYAARRGVTKFLFRIPIPATSPPSINFGSNIARIRYEVRATVGIIWKGEKQLVLCKHEVNVVERYDPRSPLTRPEAVAISENGRIWVKGEIVGDGVFAGEPACVALTVKNHSTRKNTGLSITMTRQLILPNVPQEHPLQILDTLTTVPFRGPEYIIHPGVEGVAHLIFDVPDTARTVKAENRYGGDDENRLSPNLFSIKCIVRVKMSMGFGSKDIELDLPVTVYHPSSLDITTDLARAASQAQLLNPIPDLYGPPLSPTPYDNMLPPPQNYPPAWNGPPAVPFVDNGRVYLPSLGPAPFQPFYPYASNQPIYGQPPLMPPGISPARPSSAEPIPSSPVYPPIPGLPASSVYQPLPALGGGSSGKSQRTEGKGDRASRISHHLRVSSRARSASPQSHRYTMYNAMPAPDDAATASQQSPTTVPIINSTTTPMQLSVAQLSPISAGGVVSPRPMHSPKHTVTVDPFTAAAVNKSEDVDKLERVAAETIEANADMSSSVPDLTLAVDKTLPKPPVPSSKTKPGHADDRPRAASLFPSVPEDERNTTPPTPTLAAFSSPKASRAALGVGGLDALEAKLLAEVGTRKVPQDKRPDVRTIMPISIPRPDAVPDPAVDSAISSLSLPAVGGDEGTLRLDPGSFSDRGGSEKATRQSSQGPREEVATPVNSVDVKARSRKKSTPKPRVMEEVREKEQHRLRKAAQGRVAAWLDSIDHDPPPETAGSAKSPVPVQMETDTIPPDSDTPVETAANPVRDATVAEEPHDNQETIRAPRVVEERPDDKPDPRSSGFIPLGTLRKMQLRAMADKNVALPSKMKGKALGDLFAPQTRQDPVARYDVRSARGGKGGIVTAVASLWAEQLKEQASSPAAQAPVQLRAQNAKPPSSQSPNTNKSPLSQQDHKPSVPLSRPVPSPKNYVSPTSMSTPTPTRSSPSAELAARRAKMVKASSVPAVVSSSLATPMLSSTASLARPKPTTDNVRFKTKLPPTISEAPSTVDPKPIASPKPQNELAFGKARLRELIQKYQN